MKNPVAVVLLLLMIACRPDPNQPKNNFEDDVTFLNRHTPIITLTAGNGKGKVAISPSLQGRVMTSTATGDKGISYGWINRALFKSGDTLPHMNPFGGEERLWLGPEGGQFALFFKSRDPFDFEHWQTPAWMDTEPFQVLEQSANRVLFSRDVSIVNYSNFEFTFNIKREIKLLDVEEPGVSCVAYQSQNTITNTGDKQWLKETGLLSIWLLGMFNPSDGTTVIIPFHPDGESEMGPIVVDDYFGKVPSDRLVIRDSVCYFKADGRLRSKIGFNPKRAKNVLGSYDAINKILTIVKYEKPEDMTDYVNSKWEIHKDPYAGDVTNSYNDGPPSPGAKPMGPFYEIETSSPVAELRPGESLTHTQTTYHFEGNLPGMAIIAMRELGVDIKLVLQIFARD